MQSYRLSFLMLLSLIYVKIQAQPPEDINELSKFDGIELEFVGTGGLQQSLSEGGSIPATSGAGVVFTHIFREAPVWIFQDIHLRGNINIASTVDTVFASFASNSGTLINPVEFGSSILIPEVSGQAGAIYFKTHFNEDLRNSSKFIYKIFSGLKIEIAGSNRIWKYQDVTKNTSTFMLRGGVFREFIPDDVRLTKNFSIMLGVDLSYRGIFGETGLDINDGFRERILTENGKLNFWGWEPYLSIRLKNIVAEISIPYLNKKGQIAGLSGAQVVTSIKFVGGFPLSLGN